MISCFFEQPQCLYFGSPVLDTLSQLGSSSTQDPGLLPMQSPVLLNGYPSYSSPVLQHPQQKMGKLPKETTDILKAWLHHHSDHPYPSEKEKLQLCHATGLSVSQVTNWMINVSISLSNILPCLSFEINRPDVVFLLPPVLLLTLLTPFLPLPLEALNFLSVHCP